MKHALSVLLRFTRFCCRVRLNPSHAPVTGTYENAGYADVGPANKVAQGSIALAAASETLSSPKRITCLDLQSST
jgi:hypothetical protein